MSLVAPAEPIGYLRGESQARASIDIQGGEASLGLGAIGERHERTLDLRATIDEAAAVWIGGE